MIMNKKSICIIGVLIFFCIISFSLGGNDSTKINTISLSENMILADVNCSGITDADTCKSASGCSWETKNISLSGSVTECVKSGSTNADTYREKATEKDPEPTDDVIVNGKITQHTGDNFCEDVSPTFKFAGYILLFLKILVPFMIILMGTIDLIKVVTTGKDEDMKKQGITFGKRVIAGIVIFFIPTILYLILDTLSSYKAISEDYDECITCLLKPNNCK